MQYNRCRDDDEDLALILANTPIKSHYGVDIQTCAEAQQLLQICEIDECLKDKEGPPMCKYV